MPPNTGLIPKQWKLSTNETQTSFDNWKESVEFHISLDSKSARFLTDLTTWNSSETRGFVNDTGDVAEDSRMTAIAKKKLLNIILGSVASNAPVISARYIKNVATSLEDIWTRLRQFYGFRKTGGRITEFLSFKLEEYESPEQLWERMYTYLEDNLLTANGGVKHENADVTINEEFTPTLLNVLVVNWLNTIHPSLPNAIRQRFPTQLRSNTIFSLREEISDAIPSILEDLEEKAGIGRLSRFAESKFKNRTPNRYNKSYKPTKRRCCFCEAKGRICDDHFLSQCPFLPEEDKRYMSKTREVTLRSDEDSDEEVDESKSKVKVTRLISHVPCPTIRKVDIMSSPIIKVVSNNTEASMVLDLGAEANLATSTFCDKIGAVIHPTRLKAFMADGITPLPTEGEAHFNIKLGHHSLKFSGLVVKDLDKPLIAGIPFLTVHDIYARPSTHTVFIGDCCSFKYNEGVKVSSVCVKQRTNATVLRVMKQTCLLPGETISLEVPEELAKEKIVAVEPRDDTTPDSSPRWLSCNMYPVINGSIHAKNDSSEPVLLSRHSQILQVRATTTVEKIVPRDTPQVEPPKPDDSAFTQIQVDPSGMLTKAEKDKFKILHKKYNDVFSPGIGCYNQYSGSFTHKINMSNALPPQRKGCIPNYKPKDMDLLQQKCDELLAEGVMCRPEDKNVSVTHSHPTFLLNKADGSKRMVTSFGNFADYVLVPPTVTSKVEDVLRKMGQFKYILKSDCTHSYFQIPLNEDSLQYVGVNTPYKGTYIYNRSVMGLPGSEAALEEVMSRVLGELVQSGSVVKLADDLYVGAQSVDELLQIWSQVLEKLRLNGIKLKPTKTICCPASTVILGWLWENGTLRPTTHRLNTLAVCDPPKTVKDLRSYIGSYKYMSRSLPSYADILHPLEEACSSHESGDKLVWTEQLLEAFENSKKHLKKAEAVVLPKISEQLHIICDAATRSASIGSAMYVVRNKKLYLVGHFNAKRRNHQVTWLPCEMEALCIGVSVKHFSPYILQSEAQTKVLTDSKPCVQAYLKMKTGKFSSSTRVQTFLSIIHTFRVEVIHIPGKNNIFADFASRHAVTCEGSCQICTYISELEASVVGSLQVKDIVSGKTTIPYTSRAAWLDIQKSCPELMKVKECKEAGITLSSKRKGIPRDVLRYMNCVSLSNDGLLVVKKSLPFTTSSQRIVIPRRVAAGLLTALHLELDHPKVHQMEQAFSKAFFMLDMHSTVEQVFNSCHRCASLDTLSAHFTKQSTTQSIDKIGTLFSADVIKDNSQLIMLLRESISSITAASLIPDESATSLRDGIIITASSLRSAMSPPAIIRTDPASGFRNLINDQLLQKINLQIELGDEKNPNKNPVAEKAIAETRAELVRIQPHGGKVSQATLARAISNLNSRIRHNKLSAFEMWTQREMITCDKLNLDDKELVKDKIKSRIESHLPSAKCKAQGKVTEKIPNVEVGEIVYLIVDRDKSRSRDKYIIVQLDEEYAQVQKFTGKQLRARKYRVRLSELITVKTQPKSAESVKREIEASEPMISELKEVQITPNHEKVRKQKIIHLDEDIVSDNDQVSDNEELSYSDLLARALSPEEILPQPTHPVPVVNHQADPQEPDQADVRAQRNRRAPRYLDNFVVNLANDTPLPDTSDDSDSSQIESDSEDSDYIPPGYNVRIRRRQNTD